MKVKRTNRTDEAKRADAVLTNAAPTIRGLFGGTSKADTKPQAVASTSRFTF